MLNHHSPTSNDLKTSTQDAVNQRVEHCLLPSLVKACALHAHCLGRAAPLVGGREQTALWTLEAARSRSRAHDISLALQSAGVSCEGLEADWLPSYLRSVLALKAAIASSHPTSMKREIIRCTMQLMEGYQVALAALPEDQQLHQLLKRHLAALEQFLRGVPNSLRIHDPYP